MRWDLEDLVEDAFRDYLESVVNGELQVYGSWDFEDPQYPCAIVHCSNGLPVVETATWHDARKFQVEIAIMTEAAPEVDDSASIIKTARERHASAKSKVLDNLCITGLLVAVNAKIANAAMSMAQVSGWDRTVDENRKILITTVVIDAIAEPVTGTT